MLGTATPVAFVSTTDPARARAFYETTLGLPLLADDAFAVVFDLGATTLRVTRVDALTPQPFTVLGWRVTDLATVVRDLAARGVAFERFADVEQDADGIWTAPSRTRVAWFRDPDGNVLSVSEGP
jgi:catechol 2,3-dioxygenase-like lactoylglutathione lyase family enzyme